MMRLVRLLAFVPFSILLLLILGWIAPTYAQEGPAEFHAFEPAAAPPDTELEVTLFGRGFGLVENMAIESDAIQLIDWRAVSDERIVARIFIPPDAAPGPRDILIHYILDNAEFRAFMPNAFEILPPQGPPQSPPPPIGAQFQLFAVEPSEGSPGEELAVRLLGEGFAAAQDFQVDIEGIELRDQRIESDNTIRARIFIPEGAPAGPRPVSIAMVIDDQPAIQTLEEGFNVTTSGIPPTVVWPIITIALCAASFAFGRSLSLGSKATFTRQAKVQWQVKAEKKLPDPKKACQWACRGIVNANAWNRWRVKRIELTPLDVKGVSQATRKVDDAKVLENLNDMMNLTDALRPSAEVREKLTPVATALLHQIDRWEQEGQSPASIKLDAKLAGNVKVEFRLHHCRQTSKGLRWSDDPLLKWSKKLNQPFGKHLGVMRGPAADEDNFRARAYKELKDCLEELVTSTRFLP